MKKYICIEGLFLVFLLVLGSCTEFFSTSIAPWAARDPKSLVPPVNAGNVDEIIKSAQNNPDLSLEVLKGIADAVKDANADAAAALQAAALEAAANATGLGGSLLKQVKNAPDAIKSEDAAINLILDTINAMHNLNETADSLETLLPNPNDTEEWEAFVAQASPEDMATAAVIIIAGEAKKVIKNGDDGGDYLTTFDPSAADTDHEKLALALALAAAVDGIDGSFNQFLQMLKLAPSSPDDPEEDDDEDDEGDEGEGGDEGDDGADEDGAEGDGGP